MTREELKEHCLNEIKLCEIWARLKGEETHRKLYEEHNLILELLEHEPRKGHWIRVDKDKLRCSKCDVIHFIAQYPQGKIDWCPNCGADMRGTEE